MVIRSTPAWRLVIGSLGGMALAACAARESHIVLSAGQPTCEPGGPAGRSELRVTVSDINGGVLVKTPVRVEGKSGVMASGTTDSAGLASFTLEPGVYLVRVSPAPEHVGLFRPARTDGFLLTGQCRASLTIPLPFAAGQP